MKQPEEIPFEEVLKALVDADTPLHPRFLYRLSDLEEPDMAALRQAWPQTPAWRRKALMEDVEELGEIDNLLSFEALALLALDDSDPEVRLPAIHTLWEYEEPDLIGDFIRLAGHDESPAVRAAAAAGLGRFVYAGEIEEIDADVLDAIEDFLLSVVGGGDEPLVRRRALESLGYSSRDEVPALIEAAYASGENDWIASALFAMGRSANEIWESQVLASLDSPFPAIRGEAARAAGELEIEQAAARLVELLDDPDDFTRTSSIWSLSQIGGEGVRDILEKLYDETDDEEEQEFIEEALDNLSFTEDLQLMPLFDFGEDEEEEAFDPEDLEDLDLLDGDEGEEDLEA